MYRLAPAFLYCAASLLAEEPFEHLCTPVTKAGLMGFIVGPGPTDESERIYFNFRQDGGKLFLVAVDPDTGAAEQFRSPAGTGAWGLIVGPDGRIYLGTHEGPDPQDNGQVLVFDPKHPERQIQVVGRPAESETYLWQFALGQDGKLYAGTYPGAKLVSYDPATGALADHGVMDDSQMYTRNLCVGPNGKVYLGVGYGKANVVEYDPDTGTHRSILPELYRSETGQVTASVWLGTDGNVYVSAMKPAAVDAEGKNLESVTLRFENGELIETESAPSALRHHTLRDGRRVANPTIEGTFELVSPDGVVEERIFKYQGDGAGLFYVYAGPLNRIYGGTYMPCELFWYDPATGSFDNPGNPVEVGGEIYSMQEVAGQLYLCAYPGSFLSKWDPAKPWNYGRGVENNPRGFGPLGQGHLRPRAMTIGSDNRLYIGSYPEYGMHGGSLAIWDIATDSLAENLHQLVQNQAIVSLAFDKDTGIVFGGTSTQGGGGTNPVEPHAKFFAFDPKSKGLLLEDVPFEGAQGIRSMVQVGRRIFGIALNDDLFVYNIDTKEYLHKGDLGTGHIHDCCLGLWKDGSLYGIAENRVFRLDPDSYVSEVLAEYPGSIRCGFAMDDYGIYFGDKAELIRYNWPVRRTN